jgi:hypothetical protein
MTWDMKKLNVGDETVIRGFPVTEFTGEVLAAYLLGMAHGRGSEKSERDYARDDVAEACLVAREEILRLSQVRTLEASRLEAEMQDLLPQKGKQA